MIAVSADAILLDVEGTTSSIEFVYQRMFPYVRRELEGFVYSRYAQPPVAAALATIVAESKLRLLPDALEHEATRPVALASIIQEVHRLMDDDAKTTGLKQLQGLIWESGFKSGELVAHLFSDVPGRLRQWHRDGIDLRVYSSGSVAAQKLFFGHTEFGNMLELFSGHFDTTVGKKTQVDSYREIARSWNRHPARILFVSDVAAELSAARAAGMSVVLSARPGNPAQPGGDTWPRIESFDQLAVAP